MAWKRPEEQEEQLGLGWLMAAPHVPPPVRPNPSRDPDISLKAAPPVDVSLKAAQPQADQPTLFPGQTQSR